MSEYERLLMLQQNEGLSAKDFAIELGISAPTWSNITNQKTKPSLEVMQKALTRFRRVSPDWLILGIGPMYKQKGDAVEPLLFDVKPEDIVADDGESGSEQRQTVPVQRAQKAPQVQVIEKFIEKKITRVVIFFDDGTFQEK